MGNYKNHFPLISFVSFILRQAHLNATVTVKRLDSTGCMDIIQKDGMQPIYLPCVCIQNSTHSLRKSELLHSFRCPTPVTNSMPCA